MLSINFFFNVNSTIISISISQMFQYHKIDSKDSHYNQCYGHKYQRHDIITSIMSRDVLDITKNIS